MDYCLHLYCYFHNVSADMSSGLQVFVKLGNLHRTSNYIRYWIYLLKLRYHPEMGSDIYWQEGLATGSPLSLVLGNIYMEYFEEMALGYTSLKPSMWLRYVDDTFILWPHQEDVQTLLDHVNSIQPSIQFTMEKEQDNKLPFLNVLVTCKEWEFRSSVIVSPPSPDSTSISSPIIHIR